MADNFIVYDYTGSTQITLRATDNSSVWIPWNVIGSSDGATAAAVTASGLKVDLGADNDVTLATLPDTAAGDLAALVVDAAAAEALLTTIDADTSSLAGAVSGNEVQVDIVAPIPAGTNNIGEVKITNDAGTVIDPVAQVAHDAPDANAPIKVGGYGSDTAPTDVTANGDRVNAWFKRNGSQVSSVQELPSFEYETTAASTNNTLGTGAAGDYLAGVLIIPATTSPGSVQIGDDTTDTTVFAGGADSVSNLVPFFVPINAVSASGAWSVITGANVSAIAVGSFT